jgi:hypothetical protein
MNSKTVIVTAPVFKFKQSGSLNLWPKVCVPPMPVVKECCGSVKKALTQVKKALRKKKRWRRVARWYVKKPKSPNLGKFCWVLQ